MMVLHVYYILTHVSSRLWEVNPSEHWEHPFRTLPLTITSLSHPIDLFLKWGRVKRLVTQPLSSACVQRWSTDPCLLWTRVQSIPSLRIPTQGYFSHALNHRPLFELYESVYDQLFFCTLCALCITHVGMFGCWHDSVTYLHVTNSKAFLFLTRHVVLVDSSSHCC